MRKGRYRKNLIEKADCRSFRQRFYPLLMSLIDQKLEPVDFVSSYVLLGLQTLRPRAWKGARLKSGEPLRALTALETFEFFSLRGIPLSVNRTLLAWKNGVYDLRLFFHIPSTQEVLNLQKDGIRCVTCTTDFMELGQYILNERDPLSFVLHDLIHADHFLHDPHQKAVQIGFSRWMLELWKTKTLQVELRKNSEFSAAFEYACADMNSHGAHLVKYLKAIFCQATCESLLISNAKTSCSLAFQEALSHLNTSQETTEHLQVLQNELLLKGSASGQDDENHRIGARQITA